MIERRGEEEAEKREGTVGCPLCTCHTKRNSSGLKQMSSFGKRGGGLPLLRLEVAEARVCHEVTRQREEEKQTERFHPEVWE